MHVNTIVTPLHIIVGIACIVLCSETASSNSILILGDSYTAANKGLHAILENLFKHAGDTRVVESLVSGGKDLAWHAKQVKTSGTPHEVALGSRGHEWGFVVLQDRSHVPAYCCNGNDTEFFGEYSASLAAVQDLDEIAKEHGASTVLFQTWGRRDGAPVSFLQNFELMNEQVVRGYELYAAQLVQKGRKPIIAPVGAAFSSIFDDVVSLTDLSVALTTPNVWWNLFDHDGSHPSQAGSYLSACTLYAAITNRTPVGLVGLPGLADSERTFLQKTAHDIVFVNETLARSLKYVEGQYVSNDPDVDGVVADIQDGFVIWPPQGIRTRLRKIGDHLQMIFNGKKYSGSFLDGVITWSDGDVWTRSQSKEIAGKVFEANVKSHGLIRRQSSIQDVALLESKEIQIDSFGHQSRLHVGAKSQQA